MDAFMKFDGIEGGSESKDHKGAVDVLSWNWGVTTTSTTSGAGGGAGPPRPHEFRILHHYHHASPHLA
jgi:type VI protein secretion system component Hcp